MISSMVLNCRWVVYYLYCNIALNCSHFYICCKSWLDGIWEFRHQLTRAMPSAMKRFRRYQCVQPWRVWYIVCHYHSCCHNATIYLNWIADKQLLILGIVWKFQFFVGLFCHVVLATTEREWVKIAHRQHYSAQILSPRPSLFLKYPCHDAAMT